MWRQGRATKDWFADYRGLSARVRVDPETGEATEISWYISGKVEMVSPVRATVDVAKRIATKVIDHQYVGKPVPNLYLKRIEEMFTPRSDGLEQAQEQTERRLKEAIAVCSGV
jgi:hypothetical protein